MNFHRQITAHEPVHVHACRLGRRLKMLTALLLLPLLASCGSDTLAVDAEVSEPPKESTTVRVAILDSGLSWQEDSLTDMGWNYLEENQCT